MYRRTLLEEPQDFPAGRRPLAAGCAQISLPCHRAHRCCTRVCSWPTARHGDGTSRFLVGLVVALAMGTGDDHVCGLVTNLAGGEELYYIACPVGHTHTRTCIYVGSITTVWRSSSSGYYLRVLGSGGCGDTVSGRRGAGDPDSWPHDAARDVWLTCGPRSVRWQGGVQNCQTVNIVHQETVYHDMLFFLDMSPSCKTRLPVHMSFLPAQPNQTQPMRAPETEEASGNLFRCRSRLGPSRPSAPVLLTHPRRQGPRHNANRVDSLITRPLLPRR